MKNSLQQYVIKLLNPVIPAHHQDQSGASPEQPLLSTDEVVTPEARPVRSEQLLQSSVLKYCLTESTPLFDRSVYNRVQFGNPFWNVMVTQIRPCPSWKV